MSFSWRDVRVNQRHNFHFESELLRLLSGDGKPQVGAGYDYYREHQTNCENSCDYFHEKRPNGGLQLRRAISIRAAGNKTS